MHQHQQETLCFHDSQMRNNTIVISLSANHSTNRNGSAQIKHISYVFIFVLHLFYAGVSCIPSLFRRPKSVANANCNVGPGPEVRSRHYQSSWRRCGRQSLYRGSDEREQEDWRPDLRCSDALSHTRNTQMLCRIRVVHVELALCDVCPGSTLARELCRESLLSESGELCEDLSSEASWGE